MSFESALTFFFTIFIFGITPGPGVFALLARALTSGAPACITLALGMAISDVIYLVLACFGLAAIAENWNGAFTAIRFIGAFYLLFLGWKMWTASSKANFEEIEKSGKGQMKGLLQGFLISASNPKVILFYIAFLPSFIDLSSLSRGDVALASLLTLISLMMSLMLIAVGASSARRYFRSKKAVKRLNRTAGTIMIGAGSYLALSS